MKITNTAPAFKSNYIVVVKNSERYKSNNFAEEAKNFIEDHRRVSSNRIKSTMVDLPNQPQSTMFVFSLPNHLNTPFEEMASNAKVKAVCIDRLC